MDHTPAQLIHGIGLSMAGLVLNSKTMRLFASCETCSGMHPPDVAIMDAAKITALHQGITLAVERSFRLCLKKDSRYLEVF